LISPPFREHLAKGIAFHTSEQLASGESDDASSLNAPLRPVWKAPLMPEIRNGILVNVAHRRSC
jgi:hypothetical protein